MVNYNTELYILKALFDFKNYSLYCNYVKEEFLKDNFKELYKILQVLHIFHKSFPETNVTSIEEFETFFYVQYPATSEKDQKVFSEIFNKLGNISIEPAVVQEVFRRHAESVEATRISLIGLEVSEGRTSFENLVDAARGLESLRSLSPALEDQFVTSDLTELENLAFKEPGLKWRLNALNKTLGPLRKGDFGFIFKRPETGGTTLLASEISYFVGQGDRPILWFNNEEQGSKVMLRCYQAYFNKTLNELLEKKEQFVKRFVQETSDGIKIYDSANIDRSTVERVCSRYNPSCIIFDQIDKLKGFQDDRQDIELGSIYQWARELAKEYGPAIGVCQAGVSAENKKYLTMDDVSNSKTSKQGEADWILGIGKSYQAGLEHIRFFSICKNKLLGGPDTIPELRHGQTEVRIWPERARYEDIQ